MIGNNPSRVIVNERDRQLLAHLSEAKLLDREQVQRLLNFHSINRANARLLRLHSAGLFRRFFLGTVAGGRKALYSLSQKGSEVIGVEKFWKLQRAEDELLVGEAFVEHQLAVNWCWVSAKFLPEIKLIRFMRFTEALAPSLPLLPDAYLELERSGVLQPVFLEVDLGTESSRVWEKKIELYLRLATSGEFTNIFHQPRFKIAVVCTSERRLNSLRKVVLKHTEKIFFFSLLKTINCEGFAHPRWLRPAGDARESIA